MYRWKLSLLVVAVVATGCADRDLPTTSSIESAPPAHRAADAARERLAERLAVALRDPVTRATLKQKLDASRAIEHKLQFQALARAHQTFLLASLAGGGGSTAEVLRELDQAQHLEVYLPVEAHRVSWQGEGEILVATIGRDGDRPVAFDPNGNRLLLDARTPPAMPVIALVPQETDFTGGRPHLQMSCWDVCDNDTGGGGSGGGSAGGSAGGLYLTASHFEDSFESWVKGKPEYEYHVYGVDAKGESVQLSCTGEHAGGGYAYDQNDRDWTGAVLLLSEGERAAYEQRSPGAPVRVIAMEDDDEACVMRMDRQKLSDILRRIDEAFKQITSGEFVPFSFKGLEWARSTFNLLQSIKNFITTGDDFIGNAVETTVAGPVPGNANWVLKGEGTKTNGWFLTEYRR